MKTMKRRTDCYSAQLSSAQPGCGAVVSVEEKKGAENEVQLAASAAAAKKHGVIYTSFCVLLYG